jgi:hypothetical protein
LVRGILVFVIADATGMIELSFGWMAISISKFFLVNLLIMLLAIDWLLINKMPWSNHLHFVHPSLM